MHTLARMAFFSSLPVSSVSVPRSTMSSAPSSRRGRLVLQFRDRRGSRAARAVQVVRVCLVDRLDTEFPISSQIFILFGVW
jgi:hypothetical protein